MSVNNGFKGNDTESSERGTAVGVYIDWPLQSTISVDATCAKGTGIRLEAAEFSTIMGSFSNTDSNVKTGLGMTSKLESVGFSPLDKMKED